MTIFGYARVSSTDQNEDRQMIAMNELGIPPECVFTDKQSGKDLANVRLRYWQPSYVYSVGMRRFQ